MKILNTKTLFTLTSVGLIFVAMSINSILSANQQRTPPPKSKPVAPVVSVTQASPMSQSASVVAYGEVVSRNQLTLTSQVSGQVIWVSPKFLSGNTFKKGEALIKLEPIVYEQALASAQSALAEAKLALAQEALNAEQAAQEWSQSGLADEQASDLVLRKPQLAAAKAQFQLAKKAVDKAIYDLTQTEIVAPFDALLVTRYTQIGSNIQVGANIAELYDTALFEVSLPLTARQWQLLPGFTGDDAGLQITLTDQTNEHQWQASVHRSEGHIDAESRQRALVAVVDSPLSLNTPLYPGTFVKASLTGDSINDLWQLPASALMSNNKVWQVNAQSQLSYLSVQPLFSNGDYVYVKPLTAVNNAQIVNRPLSSYLENMQVEPVVESAVEAVIKVTMKGGA